MSDWILVVDDDTSNLRMASHILSTEKMRVSSLKSGEVCAGSASASGKTHD